MHLNRKPSNDTLYISLIVFLPHLGIGVGYKTINKSLTLDSILKLYALEANCFFLPKIEMHCEFDVLYPTS